MSRMRKVVLRLALQDQQPANIGLPNPDTNVYSVVSTMFKKGPATASGGHEDNQVGCMRKATSEVAGNPSNILQPAKDGYL